MEWQQSLERAGWRKTKTTQNNPAEPDRKVGSQDVCNKCTGGMERAFKISKGQGVGWKVKATVGVVNKKVEAWDRHPEILKNGAQKFADTHFHPCVTYWDPSKKFNLNLCRQHQVVTTVVTIIFLKYTEHSPWRTCTVAGYWKQKLVSFPLLETSSRSGCQALAAHCSEGFRASWQDPGLWRKDQNKWLHLINCLQGWYWDDHFPTANKVSVWTAM